MTLYVLHSESHSTSWYPIAGVILVGIPRASLLSIYLYACFKCSNSIKHFAKINSVNHATATFRETSPEAPPRREGNRGGDVGGGRHVHFEKVVVMGSRGGDEDVEDDEDSLKQKKRI